MHKFLRAKPLEKPSESVACPSSSVVNYRKTKLKKPLGSNVNTRVSDKFNRKCIKLKLKQKLLKKAMSPIVLKSRTEEEVSGEVGSSPLTQLAHAFGGICSFRSPTSTFGNASYGESNLKIIFLFDLRGPQMKVRIRM